MKNLTVLFAINGYSDNASAIMCLIVVALVLGFLLTLYIIVKNEAKIEAKEEVTGRARGIHALTLGRRMRIQAINTERNELLVSFTESDKDDEKHGDGMYIRGLEKKTIPKGAVVGVICVPVKDKDENIELCIVEEQKSS